MKNDHTSEHTVKIPDHLWKRAQKYFGLTNPATPLRNIIEEASHEWKEAGATAKPNGSPFTAQHISTCRYCNKTLRKGEPGMKCDLGSLHLDCYDQWVDDEEDNMDISY